MVNNNQVVTVAISNPLSVSQFLAVIYLVFELWISPNNIFSGVVVVNLKNTTVDIRVTKETTCSFTQNRENIYDSGLAMAVMQIATGSDLDIFKIQ